MAADETSAVRTTAVSERRPIDRLEERVLSRRSFLAGLGIGGVGGAGAALALAREDAGFQARATLAAGASGPSPTRYYLPAIDASGRGLVVAVDLGFAAGDGGLFVNLEGVEVRHDVQLALQEAVVMATRLTDTSLAETALHVTFETPMADTIALRGKSWEAGLVVALVAGLRGTPLDGDALVTGVVNDAGRLLPVGGLDAKARSALEFGASELVVPAGQASELSVTGIDVVEVATVSAAIDRILG